jgi:diphosphate-dependent phosphofructokinase
MASSTNSSDRTPEEEKKLREMLAVTETEDSNSLLEMAIRKLPLGVCKTFLKDGEIVPAQFLRTEKIIQNKDSDKVAQVFPQTIAAHGNRLLTTAGPSPEVYTDKRIAVLFSGGPASGGHNVLVGIKKVLGKNNTLLGILSGPIGLLEGLVKVITDDDVINIINTGGFKYLGTDRTKIEKDEQVDQIKKVVLKENIDGIIFVGGDDTNTTVAYLAEKLFSNVYDDGRGVPVAGVPKTIDGDLQIENILPISFGYDTATKTYAEMVGNILVDSASSLKYWHFVKLMGRSASHVALEVALQVKPAITLVSEEIAEKNHSLHDIIEYITNIIILRASKGINYGVMIIPEGLIEFIPEMRVLINELNEVMANNHDELKSITAM